jgi:hypothetical protein
MMKKSSSAHQNLVKADAVIMAAEKALPRVPSRHTGQFARTGSRALLLQLAMIVCSRD